MRRLILVLGTISISCLRLGTDALSEVDECKENVDCSTGEICVFGRCVLPCYADTDCEGDGARCVLGACVIVPLDGGCVCGPLPPSECVDTNTYRTYIAEPFCVDEETCEFPHQDVACPNCLDDCLDAQCGDGVRAPSEECDNGNTNDDVTPDACRTDCTNAGCGDGVVDTGETCDDGDDDNADACPETCQVATCGDGFARQDPISIGMGVFEQCDDGPANDDNAANACRTNCRLAHCGDGVADTGELCDDGNNVPFDGCSPTCDFIAWQRPLPPPATVAAPPALWEGSSLTSQFHLGVATLEGDLRVYNAVSGTPLWSYSAPGESFSAPVIKPTNIFAEIGYMTDVPYAYLLSDAGRIHGLHTGFAGAARWTFDLGTATNGSWLAGAVPWGIMAVDQTGHLHMIEDQGNSAAVSSPPTGYDPLWLDGGAPCAACRPSALGGAVAVGLGTDLVVWDTTEDTAGTGYCPPYSLAVPGGGSVVGHVVVVPTAVPEISAFAATTNGYLMFGGKDESACDVPAATGWSYDTGLTLTGSPVVMAGSGTIPIFPEGPLPISGDVAIVLVAQQGTVLWLDSLDGAEPTEGWRYETGSPINASAAVDAVGTVYVSTSDARVHAISATGDLLWSVQLADAAVGSPVVEGGGVFVVTGNGTLYALERGGVAPSFFWWAREGADNGNGGGGLMLCGQVGGAPVLGLLAILAWRMRRRR